MPIQRKIHSTMKNLINNLINKISSFFKKEYTTKELTQISTLIGPMLENLAGQLFIKYNSELLNNSIDYIVPAVWGVKNKGRMTLTQMEMHKTIKPVIENVIESFAFKKLSHPQEFALGYLIRGMLISTLLCRTEMMRAKMPEILKSEKTEQIKTNKLEMMETIGSA